MRRIKPLVGEKLLNPRRNYSVYRGKVPRYQGQTPLVQKAIEAIPNTLKEILN